MRQERNEQFGTYELFFDTIPDKETRERLKSAGYRWHGVKKCWYGKAAPSFLDAEKITPKKEKKTPDDAEKEKARKQENAERKKRYIDIIMREAFHNDDGMRKYFEKEIFSVVDVDGYLIPIDKSRIETRFCFGHGQNGISTDEEEENACRLAKNAETNENYFLRENLDPVDRYIERVQKHDEIRLHVNYYGSPADSLARCLVFIDPWSNPAEWKENSGPIMSDAGRAKMVEALKEERANFEKRLNAYLKRYGLSKLDVWTYLVD